MKAPNSSPATSTSTSAAALTAKAPAKLSVMTLMIMNIVAVVSLRGLPAEAEYGLGSIFYYLFAALVFLVPVSLIAAELASAWPQKGGVYRWVGEAFGPRLGFLAIWLVWVQNTIWFPTALTFSAVSLAYVLPNQGQDAALADNKLYVLLICLLVYWLATLINLKGLKMRAKISKWGGLIGTIIPATLLVGMGIVWLVSGQAIQMPVHSRDLLPNLSNIDNLVLASSIFLFFAGMEMNAIHVKDLGNPSRDYPKAILTAALASVAIFVLGTLAIGFVVPQKSISLTQSLLVAFDSYLGFFHLQFLSPFIAVMLAIGVLAGVSTWIGGPSRGLLAVGQSGFLPPALQKTNRHGVQQNILLLQGSIVTLLVLLFVIMPSVQAVYQIISQLTVLLYLIMYMLMFAAAIALRIREPEKPRPFKIPFGKFGAYFFGCIGFGGSLLAFVLSFFPPSQIAIGSTFAWFAVLLVGLVVFVSLPLILYACRKPSWKTARDTEVLEPFGWEQEAEAKQAEQK